MSAFRGVNISRMLIQRISYRTNSAVTSISKPEFFDRLKTPLRQRSANVTTSPELREKKLTVTFINRKGEPITVSAEENSTLLDIARDNDLDLEGFGICDGTVSCSTCHVILKDEDFKKIGEAKNDDENDMLDMALGRTDTSRLGCQVILTKELDGLVVELPKVVSDARKL